MHDEAYTRTHFVSVGLFVNVTMEMDAWTTRQCPCCTVHTQYSFNIKDKNDKLPTTHGPCSFKSCHNQDTTSCITHNKHSLAHHHRRDHGLPQRNRCASLRFRIFGTRGGCSNEKPSSPFPLLPYGHESQRTLSKQANASFEKGTA